MKNIIDIHVKKTEAKKESSIKPPKKRKNIKLVIIAALLIFLSIIAAFFLWPKEKKETVIEPKKEKTKVVSEPKKEVSLFNIESPLNGALTTEEKAKRRPIAAAIENHPASRPQSGLDKAGLVYEALTEGGITRFLAFFVENDVKEVGPVRSARIYFVRFADEYNAFYTHVGGSADALALIKELDNFYNLDQFSLGKYFWRDKKRFAPHNVYSSTDLLRKAGESKKWDANADYDKYQFKNDVSENKRGNKEKITINFSFKQYQVDYYYDKSNNEYKRNLAGKEHIDKNSKQQIKAKNIIIQYVESWKVEDGIDINSQGSGKAKVFMDGEEITGTWKKLSRKQRTKFYDSQNKEIIFNRGPIWIEIISQGVVILDQ